MFDFSFIFSPNHLIRVWSKSSFIFNMLCLFDFGVVFIWFRSKSSVVISLISLSAICSLWYPSILYVHCDIPLCYLISFMLIVMFMSMFMRLSCANCLVLLSYCPNGSGILSDLLFARVVLISYYLRAAYLVLCYGYHWNMIAVSYWFLCYYYLIVVSTSFYCHLFMVLLSHCHLLLVLISTI